VFFDAVDHGCYLIPSLNSAFASFRLAEIAIEPNCGNVVVYTTFFLVVVKQKSIGK
jgi:hypothetical protein